MVIVRLCSSEEAESWAGVRLVMIRYRSLFDSTLSPPPLFLSDNCRSYAVMQSSTSASFAMMATPMPATDARRSAMWKRRMDLPVRARPSCLHSCERPILQTRRASFRWVDA